MLSVNNLSISFGLHEPRTTVVHDISFHLMPGKTLAIVGESGSGKSVTALSLLQLLPYPYAHHAHGSICFHGEELVGAPETHMQKIRGNKIAMIFQEPMTSLNPLHTLEQQVGEILKLHKNLNPAEVRARVIDLLTLVALPSPEQKLSAYPHELSGGQRQRVMIAMALANEPDILIADEPTTALDVTVQAQVLNLLRDLQKRMGMAIILITHDLGLVRSMADDVVVMKDGHRVEYAPTQKLFNAPEHPYTQQLLAAEPKGKPAQLTAATSTLLTAAHVQIHFPIKKGIFRRTVDYIRAVDDLSFTLKRGETLGIVGESGSGKTTLGLGLLRLNPIQGEVIFKDRNLISLSRLEMRKIRPFLQMVFQDPFGSLSPRMTVNAIVAEGLDIHQPRLSAEQRQAAIKEALSNVGLSPAMGERYPHEFSGGQRQRIALARALILKPDVIILDEPTSALDMSVQAQIIDLLRNLQEKFGLSYIFISHDLRVIRAMAHHVLVMKQGKVVEQGPAEDVFASPRNHYTQQLLASALHYGLSET